MPSTTTKRTAPNRGRGRTATKRAVTKQVEALAPNPAKPILTADEVKDRARHYADRVVTATAKRTGRRGGVDWTRVYIQRWRYLSGLDRTFTGPKIQPRNATPVPSSGQVVTGENVVAIKRRSRKAV